MSRPRAPRLWLLLGLLLTLGQLQAQVVYACAMLDAVVVGQCCCDEPGDMSRGCTMNSGCQDQAPPGSAASIDCCQVFYQEAPSAKATAPGSNSQVLLLDAPQPPPIPVSFDIAQCIQASHAPRFTGVLPPRVTGTKTYLLTNRFRI